MVIYKIHNRGAKTNKNFPLYFTSLDKAISVVNEFYIKNWRRPAWYADNYVPTFSMKYTSDNTKIQFYRDDYCYETIQIIQVEE